MMVVKRVIEDMEKYLMRAVVLAFLVVVLVQGMMTKDPLRLYLSWSERLEGQVVEYPVAGEGGDDSRQEQSDILQAVSPQAGMILAVEDFSALPRSIVLVNGKEKARFDHKEVELLVQAGDVIEINSMAYNFPVKYKIKEASPNLSFPEPYTVYTANQGIVMIGKIIVK